MRTVAAVFGSVVAVALAWAGGAAAADRVTVGALLANPAAYDDRDVVVAGTVGQQQWVNVTVADGNPPYQAWFPAFLLVDGQMGVWVVVRGAITLSPRSTLAVPSAGALIDVYGRFWAVSQSVEMNRPFVLLR